MGVEPAPCSALATMNTMRYFCIDDVCPSDEHSTVPFFAAHTFSKSFKSEKNHFMNVNIITCNTVEWSIKTYNGQIHGFPYIATINTFPWAALPND